MTRKATFGMMLAVLAVLGTGSAVAAAPKTVYQPVDLHEANPGFHIAPEQIYARVGDTLVLNVTNRGASTHDLVLCGDVPSSSSTCKERWGFTGPLQAEGTARIRYVLTKAGVFQYFCDIPGHKQGGMAGTLSVSGSPPATTTKSSGGLGVLGALVAVGVIAWWRRP